MTPKKWTLVTAAALAVAIMIAGIVGVLLVSLEDGRELASPDDTAECIIHIPSNEKVISVAENAHATGKVLVTTYVVKAKWSDSYYKIQHYHDCAPYGRKVVVYYEEK